MLTPCNLILKARQSKAAGKMDVQAWLLTRCSRQPLALHVCAGSSGHRQGRITGSQLLNSSTGQPMTLSSSVVHENRLSPFLSADRRANTTAKNINTLFAGDQVLHWAKRGKAAALALQAKLRTMRSRIYLSAVPGADDCRDVFNVYHLTL